jgi:hypothetical protein
MNKEYCSRHGLKIRSRGGNGRGVFLCARDNGWVRVREQFDGGCPVKPDKPPIYTTAMEVQLKQSMGVINTELWAQKVQNRFMRDALDILNDTKAMPEWRPKDPNRGAGSSIHIRRQPTFSKP